jgi:hypothetical protein
VIKASGNFAALLELDEDNDEVHCEGVNFDTRGTTTPCVLITRGQTPRFVDTGFAGDLNGALIWTNGDICQWSHCVFECMSADTRAIVFDGHNQNCSIDSNTRIGGTGKGIQVIHSDDGDPRVEGLKLANIFFINTGGANIELGDSFLTTITGIVGDQAANFSLTLSDGATKVIAVGNWFGMQGSVGNTVQIAADAGPGNQFAFNQIYGGERGFVVQASVSLRVSDIVLIGNIFDHCSVAACEWDSVDGMIAIGNVDRSAAPASGSWVTLGTHASGGDYQLGLNRWRPNVQAAYHTGSVYSHGFDRGIVMRSEGVQSVGNGLTSIAIDHGLSRAPSFVNVTPMHLGIGDFHVNTFTSTQFTVSWETATSGTALKLAWEARV